MNLADTEQKSTGEAVVTNTADTHLTGSWLIIARFVWLGLVVPSLGLFVIGLPVFYQQLQRACVDAATCYIAGALSANGLQELTTSGFSVSAYAALFTIFFVIIEAIWCVVGFLIFWRRSDDWLALLAAFFLVIFGLNTSNNSIYELAFAYPVFALPSGLVGFLGVVSLFTFFLLFPNGRLVPRWMGLILLLGIIWEFFDSFPSHASRFNANWPEWLSLLVQGVLLVAIIYSQIYRYRGVSTPVQRQQTKWVVLGVTAAFGIFIGLNVIGFFLPSNSDAHQIVIGGVIVNILYSGVILLIPLSIGFSILRYRLYDIDVLINRTLVYGSLTALLALLYFGLIFALQSLFQGLFHQNNAVAIVISTLVIAALFQPLRHRIQQVIDRRFYRRKYDAARTLAQFSATLRNEVDLTELSERLIAGVEETMQPAHVSLWLRPTQQDGKHEGTWTGNTPPS